MGAVRLATEVTKARLRHCQAIATSPTAGENVMVLALARSAQRWVGSRQPVNVLPQDQASLFEPLDSTAPAGAHLFGELRRAGYLLGIDWSHKQPALQRRHDSGGRGRETRTATDGAPAVASRPWRAVGQ